MKEINKFETVESAENRSSTQRMSYSDAGIEDKQREMQKQWVNSINDLGALPPESIDFGIFLGGVRTSQVVTHEGAEHPVYRMHAGAFGGMQSLIPALAVIAKQLCGSNPIAQKAAILAIILEFQKLAKEEGEIQEGDLHGQTASVHDLFSKLGLPLPTISGN